MSQYTGVLADLSDGECTALREIMNRHGLKGLLVLTAEIASINHAQLGDTFGNVMCREVVALIKRLDSFSEVIYSDPTGLN